LRGAPAAPVALLFIVATAKGRYAAIQGIRA
jgi:hypothetical protein